MRFILASASPRRKEILEKVGVIFSVLPSQNEEIIESENPVEVVEDLAWKKASDIGEKIKKIGNIKNKKDTIIILGADTIVVHNNQILGKPRNQEEACEMLQKLQNNFHEVYTGVALLLKKEGEEKTIRFSVCTKVEISSMTKEQIQTYVATGEPMDKAGAYAIQGKFAVYIKQLQGDYYNVVGLPIAKIYETLLEEGMDICTPLRNEKYLDEIEGK